MSEKQKLMSGMRPTGKLHFGHYEGVLTNWVKLQDEYDCYFAIADWHALTTKYDKTENLRTDVVECVLDWLASGIDPEKSTIYVQSLVPETAVLHLLLSMVTPNNWVERDPTLKDMVKILKEKGAENSEGISLSYGLLGYPVLQTADILSFNASLVPVGVDQVAHIEISRDIARRFNNIYKTEFFNEPHAKLTKIPMLVGVDGQKMGKSFNNDIKISDDEETTTKKIMRAMTDSARIRREDKGNPDNCVVVFKYYEIFADEKTVECVKCECKNAERGCADCKRQLAAIINEKFAPVRARRAEYANDIDKVKTIIADGSKKAQQEAQKVLASVNEIMQMYK